MEIRLARSLLAMLGGEPCIFGYGGRFPDEHSARLIELGESIHGSIQAASAAKGRLGYVMVEAYQNIVRHRAMPEGEATSRTRSLFLLRCHRQGQAVETRNLIGPGRQQALEARLSALRGKDTSGLKELFLEGIQRSSPPGTRGAGLGLIEMVRRAGAFPAWSFDELDGQQAVFNLSLRLGAPGPAPWPDEELAGLMWAHEIDCCYAGAWGEGIQKALFGLVREERPARTGETAERLAQGGRVAEALFRIAADERSMVLVFHGGRVPALSLGCMVDPGQVNDFMDGMQVDGVRAGHGPGLAPGSVLATALIPW